MQNNVVFLKVGWIYLLLADFLNYRSIIIVQMEVLCRGSEVGGPIGKPEALELLKVSGELNGGGGGESYNCEYGDTSEK